MSATLAGIHLYPIKSCGGIAVSTWRLDELGLEHDRRWMIIDGEGNAITRREHPALALVRTAIEGDDIRVTAPGRSDLTIPLVEVRGHRVGLSLWDWRGSGLAGSPDGDEWFSGLLGSAVRLVYCPPAEGQAVDPRYAPGETRAAFTDGYPLLVISEASLEELNRRVPVSMPMARFRPNLVVTGTEPFAEDQWRELRIGEVSMTVVKGCPRCVMTTVDPETAETGVEPLRTLATFRKWDGKVWFGQNAAHHAPGGLQVGDRVTVGAP